MKSVQQIVEESISEFDVHEQVCEYLKSKYPGTVYHTDPAGLMMTKAQAGMLTRLQQKRGWPDLFIAEPVGKYHGCFIELKRPDAGVWLKDNSISKSQHVQEQLEVLESLDAKGYYANFAQGFDEAQLIIDMYMKGEL